LWLDNDQGLYFHFVARAAALDLDQSGLGAEIKDWIEENAPDLGASTYADLLGAALSNVNWYEVAGGFIEAAQEQMEG
jgi:menaquinone-dependent protoporphyrinogen IX oxidase